VQKPLTITATAILGWSLALPAFAASVHVHTSASTRVTTDGDNRTVETSETHTVSGDGNATVNTSVNNSVNDNGTVLRAGSFRNLTCLDLDGMGKRCTGTEGESDEKSTKTRSVTASFDNDKNWWSTWNRRILKAWHRDSEVLSETTEEVSSADRAHLRLIRRICGRLAGNNREDCLEVAEESDVRSLRTGLRTWMRTGN